jgi:acyl-coenzyme A synthetase/AMP-(fatty) acid ligase
MVIYGGTRRRHRSITFGTLWRRSDRVAAALQGSGTCEGDRVGLSFPATGWIDYAVGFFAVLRAGAVAVPMGEHHSQSTMHKITDLAAVTRTVGPGLLAELEGRPRQRAVDFPTVSASAPAQILYTSGTTGTPKGVVASHANLASGLSNVPRRRPLAHSRHSLHAFALGTNAGQSMLLQMVVAAPAMVVVPGFDAESYAAAIEELRIGSAFLVPSMAAELISAGVWDRYDLGSLVLLGSTAAALPTAVAMELSNRLPAVTLTNCYTSTEAAPAQLTMVFDRDRPTAVGWSGTAATIRVTTPDGAPVPAGVTGQIWLRSADAPRRYLDSGAASTVFGEGWVAMGDHGYLDADGYLYLVDRSADLIKPGGLAGSTLRVENALAEHPAIAEAAVVGIPHPTLGEVAAAAVTARPGWATVADLDLRSFLAERVDRHELPVAVRWLPELPHNAAGKVRKDAIRAVLKDQSGRRIAAPASRTEKALAELWSRLLDTEVGRDDDFFALGGDSLRATQLASLACDTLGAPITTTLIFERPGLADQAAWIDTHDGREPATAPAEKPDVLSALQLELLRWMNETSPARDVGPMYVCLEIDDDIDVPALRAALTALARRHQALHTRFVREPSSGWIGRPEPSLEPELLQHSATDPASGHDLVMRELRRPFDLGQGPLVRGTLVFLGEPERYLFALVAHHLVVDGWSFGVILRELGELYTAARLGTVPKLSPAVQAADVIAWHRASWPQERAWWHTVLDGVPPLTFTPSGHRITTDYAAAGVDSGIDARTTVALRATAAEHRTTSFVVAAADWLDILAGHTGAETLVVLTPVTGRGLPAFEGAVGCLAQTLLIPIRVANRPSRPTLIRRLRDGLLAAIDHQRYPMHEFTAAVPVPVEIPFARHSGRTHLPGLFSREHALPPGLVWRWPLAGPDYRVPKLELTEDDNGVLRGLITYNRNALDPAVVQGLADELRARSDGRGTDHAETRSQ